VRGDTIRADLHRKVAVVLEALDELEISTPNTSGLPIIEIPLADHRDVDEVGQFLFDRGIYTTIAAYPLVPRTEVGFRVQVTSANDDDQIARLVAVLGELSTKFRLQTAQTMAQWWDGNRASALRA
jgi:7-keto-8-aminopelargonate synthetase-like enzyme